MNTTNASPEMQEVWIGRLGRILPELLLRPPYSPLRGAMERAWRGWRGFPSKLSKKKSKNFSKKKTKFFY